MVYTFFINYFSLILKIFDGIDSMFKLFFLGLTIIFTLMADIIPLLRVFNHTKVSDFIERIVSLIKDWNKICAFHIVSFIIFCLFTIVTSYILNSAIGETINIWNNR